MTGTGIFHRFFNSEKTGGILLIGCTLISLLLANSSVGPSYLHFWHLPAYLRLGTLSVPYSLEAWINDGLMTVFFLLVGLEIERELYQGELATKEKALLPVIAAIGGMAVPAAMHLLLNRNTPTSAGFGIPMATDIAFSLGVLSLMGKRFPPALKIFLTALAIIDDLGAVIVIAIFYTDAFSWLFLGLALVLTAFLALLRRLGCKYLRVFLPFGVLLWYLLYRSGIHPTLSGILLAFVIPFRESRRKRGSPSERLENALHKPVAFVIVPLFALANTAIRLPEGWYKSLLEANSIGIALGLTVGKCLGIAGFSLAAIKSGVSVWPEGMRSRRLIGLGMLGGIGFTMSIFISNLAYPGNQALIDSSKVAVLLASFTSALIGWLVLRNATPPDRIRKE